MQVTPWIELLYTEECGSSQYRKVWIFSGSDRLVYET
jgi:hypothetical protein